MLAANIPPKFPLPFANNAAPAYTRPIPTASQVGITPGAASLYDGFPPVTFIPESSGGVPPFGQDFNGLLNQITQWIQWLNAGAQVLYDATFSAAIGGYPKGALILANVGTFWYLSTIDNNTSNPNTGGANWVQVVPSSPSVVVPLMDGTGTIGTSLFFARADHIHPVDTSRASLTYVNSTFETITAAALTYLPILNPVAQGGITVQGDGKFYRPGAPTTGVVYLNQANTRYLYFDGSSYNLPGSDLNLAGTLVGAGIVAAQTTATNAGNAAAAAQGTANTGVTNAAAAQASANTALNSAFGSTTQAYSDVTGSRGLGTIYTNSTARPIFVFIRFLSGTGAHGLTSNVNGLLAAAMNAVNGTGEGVNIFVVPPGQTYQVNSGGFVTVAQWLELR